MRALIPAVVAILIAAPGLRLEACGDKFLALGRGLSFNQAYRSLHPGTVFIYSAAKDVGNLTREITKGVSRAGHTVSAGGPSALTGVIRDGRTDIILAAESDAAVLQPLVAAAAAPPTVIYLRNLKSGLQAVVPSGSGAILTVKLTDGRKFLSAIEEAMKVRKAAVKGRRV